MPTGYTPQFVLAGASSILVEGSVGVNDLTFPFTASSTAALPTGQYWYQIIATQDVGDGRVFISEGSIFINGAISGSGAYDGRSAAEKIVAAIDATMINKATSDQQSYVIQSGSGSRSLSRLNMDELIAARKVYATIVATENRSASGAGLFKRHTFEFRKP